MAARDDAPDMSTGEAPAGPRQTLAQASRRGTGRTRIGSAKAVGDSGSMSGSTVTSSRGSGKPSASTTAPALAMACVRAMEQLWAHTEAAPHAACRYIKEPEMEDARGAPGLLPEGADSEADVSEALRKWVGFLGQLPVPAHSGEPLTDSSEAAGACHTLEVTFLQASGLAHIDPGSDAPWCTCEVKHMDRRIRPSRCQTVALAKTQEPRWNETQLLERWQVGEPLEFSVLAAHYDKGYVGSRTEGKVVVPSRLFYPQGFEGELPISGLENAFLRLRILPPGVVEPPQPPSPLQTGLADDLVEAGALPPTPTGSQREMLPSPQQEARMLGEEGLLSARQYLALGGGSPSQPLGRRLQGLQPKVAPLMPDCEMSCGASSSSARPSPRYNLPTREPPSRGSFGRRLSGSRHDQADLARKVADMNVRLARQREVEAENKRLHSDVEVLEARLLEEERVRRLLQVQLEKMAGRKLGPRQQQAGAARSPVAPGRLGAADAASETLQSECSYGSCPTPPQEAAQAMPPLPGTFGGESGPTPWLPEELMRDIGAALRRLEEDGAQAHEGPACQDLPTTNTISATLSQFLPRTMAEQVFFVADRLATDGEMLLADLEGALEGVCDVGAVAANSSISVSSFLEWLTSSEAASFRSQQEDRFGDRIGLSQLRHAMSAYLASHGMEVERTPSKRSNADRVENGVEAALDLELRVRQVQHRCATAWRCPTFLNNDLVVDRGGAGQDTTLSFGSNALTGGTSKRRLRLVAGDTGAPLCVYRDGTRVPLEVVLLCSALNSAAARSRAGRRPRVTFADEDLQEARIFTNGIASPHDEPAPPSPPREQGSEMQVLRHPSEVDALRDEAAFEAPVDEGDLSPQFAPADEGAELLLESTTTSSRKAGATHQEVDGHGEFVGVSCEMPPISLLPLSALTTPSTSRCGSKILTTAYCSPSQPPPTVKEAIPPAPPPAPSPARIAPSSSLSTSYLTASPRPQVPSPSVVARQVSTNALHTAAQHGIPAIAAAEPATPPTITPRLISGGAIRPQPAPTAVAVQRPVHYSGGQRSPPMHVPMSPAPLIASPTRQVTPVGWPGHLQAQIVPQAAVLAPAHGAVHIQQPVQVRSLATSASMAKMQL
eukprot:TRINITY_DN3012_c0_g2_i1.p1 TRINITY_DN3012_c0_g2~~TRINITY_DN3012_c0_g2_i1.p1  ORF type:complete len:1121 (-),score=199.79 TRINITY_DN3012_c0_g2_i1:120-3482(-)